MKKIYMLMVAMLCGVAAMAQEVEGLYINPIKVEKGETAATLELCLRAKTELGVQGFSTRIQFPEGVNVKLKKSGNPVDMSVSEDYENGHSAEWMKCTDGNWQLAVKSANPFNPMAAGDEYIDGCIIEIPITISEEVAAVDGTYPIKLYMISISGLDNTSLTLNGTFVTEFEAADGLTVGEGTGIIGINADDTNAPIYNVAGQRVSKAQKGIFIQNGKKVAVK